ncbi:MAG: nucleoside-diphosphate kinase [Clostridiaceae bacterium]
MEKTLVLIKPDAVERNLIGKILAQYEENGLKITRLEMIQAKKSVAEEHYLEHLGRPYYEKLISYITRSPLVALVLEGEEAISTVRQINGKTNPLEAEKGTIRALYGIDKSYNTVHASDSISNAEREINIWFK